MALSICIDGFNMAMPRGSGIATYAYNLCSAVRELGHAAHVIYGSADEPSGDALLDEISLYDAPPRPSAARTARRVARDLTRLASPFTLTARRVRRSGEVITRHIERRAPACDGLWTAQDVFHRANLAFAASGRFSSLRFEDGAAGAPELMHWTCPLPLKAPGRPNLYTLHDLVPLRLPFATLDNKRRFLDLCRAICAGADAVVTVSEHSRRDIVRLLGVDEARVKVTWQAADLPPAADLPEAEAAREIAGVFGLDWRGYYLFFGAIEPKKNLARLIEAYLGAGVDAPLLIIGGRAWLAEDETRLLYPDLVRDRVRVYDYLPRGLLTSLIRGARATLFPSLYEGFGLPVLESMLLRTPVLASTGGALPEIAGDAALLADPYDVEAIRAAIRDLDGDAGLRDELTARGVRQAKRFSPEAYRERLADLYRPFG